MCLKSEEWLLRVFFVLNVNLKGENNIGNLIQYIAQEDPEKNRPW